MTATARDANYFSDRYGMSATHSEVVEAAEVVRPGKVLDLGCGSGRNALYLASLGHEVTAVDANPGALNMLEQIVAAESMDNLQSVLYDINQAAIEGEYDFIVATVVLMFLQPDRVPEVIANMQQATASGGHNLIVCAMDTEAHPCDLFPFKFAEGELKDYYKGWELLKYNENVGAMHRRDAAGNPVEFQFATLLARKP